MGYKVLIAQGDPKLSQLMIDEFTALRFEVAVAKDGREALQYFHAFLPDVIIIDADYVNDPLLTIRMRRSPQGAQSVMFVITSRDDQMTPDELAQADAVFIKPVTMQQLIDSLRLYISSVFKTKPLGNEIRAELRQRLTGTA